MKLLDKKAAATQVAMQKKAQIDEGMKLANKVDALRETLVQEEGNLARFRTETIAKVQTEINSYIGQKDILKDEIKVLERRKKTAQIPLDAEWEKVAEERRTLAKEADRIAQLQEDVIIQSEKNEHTAKELEIEQNRITDERTRTKENLSKADDLRQEAQTALYQSREKAHEILVNAELKEKIVSSREEDLSVRESRIEDANEKLAAWEKDLSERELRLKDRYETLLRTQYRLKNK